MDCRNLPPTNIFLAMICSEGASANRLLLCRRRMLITSGATGGKERPLHYSAPKVLDYMDYGNLPPKDNSLATTCPEEASVTSCFSEGEGVNNLSIVYIK
jgi:hypothetical protein